MLLRTGKARRRLERSKNLHASQSLLDNIPINSDLSHAFSAAGVLKHYQSDYAARNRELKLPLWIRNMIKEERIGYDKARELWQTFGSLRSDLTVGTLHCICVSTE